MADIYEVANPPHRVPIPIVKAGDRIGKTYIPVDPAKIVAIVPVICPMLPAPWLRLMMTLKGWEITWLISEE
ncbi:MAG: hypothetical protein ACLUIQ_05820 [Dialister invisus]